MAKLSQLVKEMAQVTGVREGSVNVIARQLREAGMLSTGGRGPGGADVTATDCTNLLLALVCQDRGASIPARVANYRASSGMVMWEQYSRPITTDGIETGYRVFDYKPDFFKDIEDEPSLGTLIDFLFRSAEEGSLLDYFAPGVLKCLGMSNLDFPADQLLLLFRAAPGVGVKIEFNPGAYHAKVQLLPQADIAAFTVECRVHPDLLERAWEESADDDLKVRVSVSTRTFLKIGALLAAKPSG